MTDATDSNVPIASPWRAPALDRSESERNIDPPDEQRVAEHQKELRKRSDGVGAGADEMAEETVEPKPQHQLSGVGGLAPLVDAGLAGQDSGKSPA